MTLAPPRRRFAFWLRWIHVYVSMIGFLALLGFAVTGLTLNHAEAFEGEPPEPTELSGQLDETLLPDDDALLDRLAIVEALRGAHPIHGAVHDFIVDPDQLVIVFKAPGYSADAVIGRPLGDYTMTTQARGAWAVLDDLHKGRDAGPAWSIVVDASAALMALTSLTGIWLLLYVKKRRGPALWAGLAGALTLVAVWWLSVP
ncbi:MAG: PepSY-associated TM helix domain-containing protein [Planctomycetes bacterium]|nr:PepSY-associated TM helix domain-containing protein [Planctomycetota bacterium]